MVSHELLEPFSSSGIENYTQPGQISETDVSTTVDVSSIEASVINSCKAQEVLYSFDDNEAIVDGNKDLFLNTILNQGLAKLAASEDINDVADAFRQMDNLIGKAEYVLAIMISYIREQKIWKHYGYSSMNKFLDDLPVVCKWSRQTINNAAQAGQIICHLSGPAISYTGMQLDFTLTPAFFYRNYAKVKFLYRIFYIWNLIPTTEVMVNFRDMTYREFESFMVVYEEQNKAEIERLARLNGKTLPKKYHKSRPKSSKIPLPVLAEQDLKIYQEVRLGRLIGYIFTSNQACVESIIGFIKETTQREYEALNKKYREPSEIFFDKELTQCAEDMDWADLCPHNLILATGRLSHLLDILSPEAIKEAFYKGFKTKTELTLAQAYLIKSMEEAPLAKSIYDYLTQHHIGIQFNPAAKDFCFKVLEIDESRYKWLKRIAGGLTTLTMFKGNVRFTSEGFLEKLAYLHDAYFKHGHNLSLVVDALNTVSAKRFREFASNCYDNLSSDPITMKDYLKAKPYIDKLHVYHSKGKSVSVIGLHSEREERLLDMINMAMEPGREHLQNRYPGIIWDSNFKVEYGIETTSIHEENKQERLTPIREPSTDVQFTDTEYQSISKAA